MLASERHHHAGGHLRRVRCLYVDARQPSPRIVRPRRSAARRHPGHHERALSRHVLAAAVWTGRTAEALFERVRQLRTGRQLGCTGSSDPWQQFFKNFTWSSRKADGRSGNVSSAGKTPHGHPRIVDHRPKVVRENYAHVRPQLPSTRQAYCACRRAAIVRAGDRRGPSSRRAASFDVASVAEFLAVHEHVSRPAGRGAAAPSSGIASSTPIPSRPTTRSFSSIHASPL